MTRKATLSSTARVVGIILLLLFVFAGISIAIWLGNYVTAILLVAMGGLRWAAFSNRVPRLKLLGYEWLKAALAVVMMLAFISLAPSGIGNTTFYATILVLLEATLRFTRVQGNANFASVANYTAELMDQLQSDTEDFKALALGGAELINKVACLSAELGYGWAHNPAGIREGLTAEAVTVLPIDVDRIIKALEEAEADFRHESDSRIGRAGRPKQTLKETAADANFPSAADFKKFLRDAKIAREAKDRRFAEWCRRREQSRTTVLRWLDNFGDEIDAE